MGNDLVPIDFHGDAIWAAPPTRSNDPLVSLRPIVERFGLSWSSQLKRLRRDDVLAPSVVIMTTETAAGPRDAVCVPLNLLPGFLFGISVGSVPDPEVRERVLTYKRECHDVLYQHFFGRAAERKARAEREELRDKLKAVQIATGLRGHAAGAHIWHELGLPPLPEGQPAPTGGKRPRAPIADAPFNLPDEDARATAVRQFVVDRLEPHVGGSIPTTEVYRAYCAWAAEHGTEALTTGAFGVVTTHLRIPKGRRGAARHYRNVRFKPLTPETLQ